MTEPVDAIDSLQLVSGDEIVAASATFPWLMIVVLMSMICVVAGVLWFVRLRTKSCGFDQRGAWLELADSVGMTRAERRALETLCSTAALDPCVIALCPSRVERVILLSSGTPDRVDAWSAVRKLHPLWIPPELQAHAPSTKPDRLRLKA